MANKQNDLVGILTLALLIVTLLLWLNGNFSWITQDDVEDAVTTAIENADLGGSAAAPTPTPTPSQPTAPAVTKVSLGDLEDGLEWTYVQGEENAKISIIEFSDVECPFCQRHVNNGTIDSVIEKYEGDVNAIFMHFPLGFHPLAQKAWEAIECAGDLDGTEWFVSYKKALFAKWGKPTLDVIKTVAEETGFDADEFMECVNGWEFAQTVKDQMAFGRSLGVTGTPGNIVMNNETWDFIKVSWAVPATSFDSAITQLMDK